MLIKVKTRCQSPFHPCLHGHRQTVWLYGRPTFTLHFEFPLWHTWTWPYTKCTLQLLLSLNSSHPSTHGTDKAQSGPLSFTDIYFTLFIDLHVKIIWESVLRRVDLREHLHRTLSSPPHLAILCLPFLLPNQNHIDPGFERGAHRELINVYNWAEWVHYSAGPN